MPVAFQAETAGRWKEGEPVLFDDELVFGWFALVAVSVVYVVWENFVRRNPEPTVMRWGWVLITLYMGPVAVGLYVLADKEPRPDTHEEFVRPLWKQGVGSAVHCVAGDATAIITAAVIVAALGLPMSVDLAIEYTAGFLFGLFIFQALFMKSMAGGKYWLAVRRSLMPEWLSMNMMAAGMFVVMTLLMMGRDMRAMEPTRPQFWFVMSISVIAGFATCYPVNVWLVARKLKHGLMTVRPGDQQGGAHASMHHEPSTDAHAQMNAGSSPGPDVSAVTRAQLVTVTMLTVLAMVVGIAFAANRVNLNLGADDVDAAIMPPGMVMTNDTPGEAMTEMAAVDPGDVSREARVKARGDRRLAWRDDGGIKVFDLDVSIVKWHILDDQPMLAYAFNGQVPGPRIEVTEGDRVRFNVTNNLPEPTSVHWHGFVLPNRMDGPAEITQAPIEPGATFRYEFDVVQAGTYFYHSHREPDRQQALGMYGAIIVKPSDAARDAAYDYDHDVVIELQEWLEREGYTYPAMLMEGGLPNFFTINGKAYPETETIKMRVGERTRFRFIGSHNNFIHPMHIHGGPFEIVETDGNVVPPGAILEKDTVNVGPGERYDVIWEALRPGKWLLHCHIPHHTTNDNHEIKGVGGLTLIIEVTR